MLVFCARESENINNCYLHNPIYLTIFTAIKKSKHSFRPDLIFQWFSNPVLTVLRKEVSSAPPSSSDMLRLTECHENVTSCHADLSSPLSRSHKYTEWQPSVPDQPDRRGWCELTLAALLTSLCSLPSVTSFLLPRRFLMSIFSSHQILQNCNAKITGGCWHLWL